MVRRVNLKMEKRRAENVSCFHFVNAEIRDPQATRFQAPICREREMAAADSAPDDVIFERAFRLLTELA